MNREIKFRAWIESRKLLLQPFIQIEEEGLDISGEMPRVKKVIFTQYSGIKDKADKEIYEGG